MTKPGSLFEIKRERNRLEFRLKQLAPIGESVAALVRIAADDRDLAVSARDCLAAIKQAELETQTVLDLLNQRLSEAA